MLVAMAAACLASASTSAPGMAQTTGTAMPTLPCCSNTGDTLVADLSTGQFVGLGVQDPYWTVMSTPSNLAQSPAYAVGPSFWYAAPSGTHWIEAAPGATVDIAAQGGVYVYHLDFYIAQNPALYQSFTLSGSYVSDDSVIEIKINSTPIPGFVANPSCCSTQYTIPNPPISLFHQGLNTLEIRMTNSWTGAEGLLVSARLTAVCSICLTEPVDPNTGQPAPAAQDSSNKRTPR